MNFRIGQVQVENDGQTVAWTSGLAVDADGSPFAYAPANSGLPALDALGNAGKPGQWWGLACDAHGVPYVQGADDPAPGYYVSTTALVDGTKPDDDPRRYVDSQTVPYVSVPPELLHAGVRKGDLCEVVHGMQRCMAIVADVGPRGKIGEGSIALATALGLPSSPRNGGVSCGVSFKVLLGTAASPPWPRDLNA